MGGIWEDGRCELPDSTIPYIWLSIFLTFPAAAARLSLFVLFVYFWEEMTCHGEVSTLNHCHVTVFHHSFPQLATYRENYYLQIRKITRVIIVHLFRHSIIAPPIPYTAFGLNMWSMSVTEPLEAG
jgi:hypothetical protein